MLFVRKLALVCLKHNIYYKSKHVPGLQNKLADSLSRDRLQLQTFRQLAPAYMHKAPTVIPPHLQPLNVFHSFLFTSRQSSALNHAYLSACSEAFS